MEIQNLTPNDLPALASLCQLTLPHDTWSVDLLEYQLLEQPNANPAHQLLAWQGSQLVGAMLGGTRDSDEGTQGWIRLFATHPRQQRRGVATTLLQEFERRMQADGITKIAIANSVPCYFWPGLDVRYTPAFCFLQRHGYQQNGEGINMYVDLNSQSWDTSDEEAFLSLEGFSIRRLQPNDRIAFSDWLLRTWSPAWQAEGLLTLKRDPIPCFVAEHNGRICAFAAYGVASFPYSFGPTGTEEVLRGKGLGRVLFYRCMQDLKEHGHNYAEVSWVGPIVYYAKIANATIHRVFWYLEKSL